MPDEPQTADGAEQEPVRLFNRTATPLVPNGLWGSGAIMPGESFETTNPEGYAPDQPGSPWTLDAEAAAALLRMQDPGTGVTSQDASTDGTEPQDAPQAPSSDPGQTTVATAEVPVTHMLAGAIVAPSPVDQEEQQEQPAEAGHPEPSPEGGQSTGGTA